MLVVERCRDIAKQYFVLKQHLTLLYAVVSFGLIPDQMLWLYRIRKAHTKKAHSKRVPERPTFGYKKGPFMFYLTRKENK